jgi:hypothetical protein
VSLPHSFDDDDVFSSLDLYLGRVQWGEHRGVGETPKMEMIKLSNVKIYFGSVIAIVLHLAPCNVHQRYTSRNINTTFISRYTILQGTINVMTSQYVCSFLK